MGFIIAALLTIFAIEYFLRIRFLVRVQTMIHIVKQTVHILLSNKISEHWKETALLAYARKLMANSVVILFMLIDSRRVRCSDLV